MSPFHKEALDHLLYGINERKGFIAITGGIGTGKTTLCRAFLNHLDGSTKTALVFNPSISDRELLKTTNQEFGIQMDPAATSKNDHIDALNHFLLKTFSSGGNAVLLIDEAQNLSHAVLEQIRMLSNLETEKEKLIQIVLVGQSELKELLTSPSLKQLDERITVRYDLRPLDRKHIKGYVEHRLVVAGGGADLRFTSGAFEKIYAYSKGNPRRINAVCDRALLIAYAGERYVVSKGMVSKAVEDIRGKTGTENPVVAWSGMRVKPLTVLVFLLLIVACLAGWKIRKLMFGLSTHEQEISLAGARNVSPTPVAHKRKASSLFLDEHNSLAGLFRLFNEETGRNGLDRGGIYTGLISFNLKAEHYAMLKRPFRVSLSNSQTSFLPFHPGYLLIRQVTPGGAIALDTEERDQPVTRDFVLTHWDREVSWVFPHNAGNLNLVKGMSSPDVLRVQETLNELGYIVQPTGFFGQHTFNKVTEFQADFGLTADGIVGPRTWALLYQMVE
ncbi:MAG: AAA family ATPase [Thermodesulfobacteriota bacterium]|nr:AAA family ATPase [Thermodesulfobacteriota bacterium]